MYSSFSSSSWAIALALPTPWPARRHPRPWVSRVDLAATTGRRPTSRPELPPAHHPPVRPPKSSAASVIIISRTAPHDRSHPRDVNRRPPTTTRTGDSLITYPGVARRNHHQTSGAARSGDSAAYLLPHAGTADSQRDPGYKRVLTNSGVSARATPRRLPQSERERHTHTHARRERERGRAAGNIDKASSPVAG